MYRKSNEILIVGYGKMGKIYEKHLTELGHIPSIYDICGPHPHETSVDISKAKYIIVSTPTETHYSIYESIRKYNKTCRILVEKPVIIDENHMGIFDDPLVYSGMCERHNKAILFLKEEDFGKLADVADIYVTRFSNKPGNLSYDLLIHDLDINEYLFDGKATLNTYYAFPKMRNNELYFYNKDIFFDIDLTLQEVSIDGDSVYKSTDTNTIKYQLAHFLMGGKCNAKEAHKKMFQILKEQA